LRNLASQLGQWACRSSCPDKEIDFNLQVQATGSFVDCVATALYDHMPTSMNLNIEGSDGYDGDYPLQFDFGLGHAQWNTTINVDGSNRIPAV